MNRANNAPIYASIYAELAEVCRSHGYALAVHGSLARDFDLVCIPWAEKLSTPVDVVRALTEQFALRLVATEEKPWKRGVYTLAFAWGDVFLDLSFTPAPTGEEVMVERWSLRCADGDPWADPDPDGRWVRHSDYETLLSQARLGRKG